MIAKVIPLRRLPRRFDFFIYAVRSRMTSRLKIGQLVIIPFQSEEIFGVVYRLEKTAVVRSKLLKEIEKIVYDEPLFSSTHLQFFSLMHFWCAASLSTIVSSSAPPLQKKKLTQIKLSSLTSSARPRAQVPRLETYVTRSDHARLLNQIISGNTLILVPQISLIDEVYHLLSDGNQTKSIIWHSELSIKEQFACWFSVRANEKKIVIGARGAVFLPFVSLDTIIVDYEQDQGHKHFDQIPRFHVKDAAQALAELFNSSLFFTSFSPSCESYFYARKRKWQSQFNEEKKLFTPNYRLPTIINLKNERQAGNRDPLAERLKERLISMSGDVFLFLNRLGFASAVICQDCGYRAICPSCQLSLIYHEEIRQLRCQRCYFSKSVPLMCKQCQSSSLKFFGIGTEQLEKFVKALFPTEIDIEFVRIDSETNPRGKKGKILHATLANKKRHIIIGTKMALAYVPWEKVETIVFVDFDSQLGVPEIFASEEIWHSIQEICFRQTNLSTFFIQTHSPTHLLLRSLAQPDLFYRTELNLRRSLGYSPYRYLARYSFGHLNQLAAKKEVERVFVNLSIALTEEKKNITLHVPSAMHPAYYRRKFWYTIIAQFNPDSWKEDLTWFNNIVPENWKIDPRPILLLSH